MLLTLTLPNQTYNRLLSLYFALLSILLDQAFILLSLCKAFSLLCWELEFTFYFDIQFFFPLHLHQPPIAASASISASFFRSIFSLNHYISLTKSLPYLVVTWIYTLHYDRWACIQWRVKIHFNIFKSVKCTRTVYQHGNTNEIDKTMHWL